MQSAKLCFQPEDYGRAQYLVIVACARIRIPKPTRYGGNPDRKVAASG